MDNDRVSNFLDAMGEETPVELSIPPEDPYEKRFTDFYMLTGPTHLFFIEYTETATKEKIMEFLLTYSEKFVQTEEVHPVSADEIRGNVVLCEKEDATSVYDRGKPAIWSDDPKLFIIDDSQYQGAIPCDILDAIIHMSNVGSLPGDDKLPNRVGYVILSSKVEKYIEYVKSESYVAYPKTLDPFAAE